MSIGPEKWYNPHDKTPERDVPIVWLNSEGDSIYGTFRGVWLMNNGMCVYYTPQAWRYASGGDSLAHWG